MKPLLFLDIDGVVNHEKTSTRWNAEGHLIANDPFCVFLVNKIVDETGCDVVLSSSWRHMDNWREVMRSNGFVFDFLDRTPVDGDEILRGEQVKRWLEAHPGHGPVAILDDNAWFREDQQSDFFRTSWSTGITEKIAEKVRRHLTGKGD